MASIDTLPDEILVHIISFVSTRDCVRSSILGKRWRFLWALVPNLKLDRWDHKTLTSFSNFVYKFVFVHKGHTINTFRLHTKYGEDASEIETLIGTAIGCNVQVLEMHSDFGFTMPQCLFTCKTLVDLTLSGVCVKNVPMTGTSVVYLPALRKLQLKRVYFESQQSRVHLISGCRALEELTVLLEEDDDDVDRVFVSSPTLTRLSLEHAFDKICEVKLDTPALKYLRLHDFLSREFSAGMLASLTEADVFFDAPTFVLNDVFEFVGKLNNVNYLKLRTGLDWMGVPDFAFTTAFTTTTGEFRNLTKLELDGDWRFLTTFLENSDNLQVLILVSKVNVIPLWVEPKQVPVCVIHHLGTVRFDGFECSEPEFDMVSYILRNAKVLKRMEINVSSTHRDLRKTSETLRGLLRLSEHLRHVSLSSIRLRIFEGSLTCFLYQTKVRISI